MMNKGNLSYGLNARSGGTGGNSSKGKKKKKGLSGFGDDESDDSSSSDKDTNNTKTSARSTINKEIQAEQEALRKRAQAAMAKSTSASIEYNYDDEYDNFSSNKKKEDAAAAAKQKLLSTNNEPKQSRYINTLLKTAQRRNQEQEIIYERQVQKDQSIEDPLYEGKDKFITSSYKRKLQERELWSKQEKERSKREEIEDVTKKGKGMGNFMFSGIGRSMLVGSGKDTVDINDDEDIVRGDGNKLGGLKKESEDMDRGGEESDPRGTDQWDNTKRSRDMVCNDDDYTNRKRPPPTFGESNMGSDNINSSSTNSETKKDPLNTVKTRQQVLEERAIKIREARERYFQRRGITTSQ